MLKKINRGLQNKDYAGILGNGTTIQTPLFGIKYQLLPSLRGDLPLTRGVEQSKFGWIISKKISKKAVDRNKIKRRLSEVIVKKMVKNVHLVILVKKNILDAKIGEIEKCWDIVYEKISSKNNSSV